MTDPEETPHDDHYRRMMAGAEVFLDEEGHHLGWNCWTCGADKIGFNSWREAQIDADDHSCEEEIQATKPEQPA